MYVDTGADPEIFQRGGGGWGGKCFLFFQCDVILFHVSRSNYITCKLFVLKEICHLLAIPVVICEADLTYHNKYDMKIQG